MEDETIEDVRAAYALLHRDMAALRVKADALMFALREALKDAHPYISNDELRTRIGNLIAKAEGV